LQASPWKAAGGFGGARFFAFDALSAANRFPLRRKAL
jgi:hypothetical protein